MEGRNKQKTLEPKCAKDNELSGRESSCWFYDPWTFKGLAVQALESVYTAICAYCKEDSPLLSPIPAPYLTLSLEVSSSDSPARSRLAE